MKSMRSGSLTVLLVLGILVPSSFLPSAAVANHPCGPESNMPLQGRSGQLAPGDTEDIRFIVLDDVNFLLHLEVQTLVGELGPEGGITRWSWADRLHAVWWSGTVQNQQPVTQVSGHSPDNCVRFSLTNVTSGDFLEYSFVVYHL